jgi:biopolymer transport protein ExbD
MTRGTRSVARCVEPAGGGTRGEINVTPLVDVVLVLLLIFMVVTPLREEALRLRVPDADAASAPRTPRPQLVVGVLPSGALTVDGAPVSDDRYEERLGAALGDLPEGGRVVFFAAADPAPYRRLVLALDGARRAGAEILAFTAGPGEGRPARR